MKRIIKNTHSVDACAEIHFQMKISDLQEPTDGFARLPLKIEFEAKRAFLVSAQVGHLHLGVNFGASVDVGRIFYGTLQALGSHQSSIWEEDEAFYDMRNKIVRRLPSWQRSGVVSQQRLRLGRFDSLVKRERKLRSEPVSFLFLVCFSNENSF